MQALVVEPGACPRVSLTGPEIATALLDEQALKSPRNVTVETDELGSRVTGSEVVTPSPKEQVQPSDDVF